MARLLRWLGYAALLTLISLAIAVSAARSAPTPQTSFTARVYIPLNLRETESAPPPDMPFGVSDRPTARVVDSPQAIHLLRNAGLLYDRTSVVWSLVEPADTTPEHYNWTQPDGAIKPLLAEGIQPFVLLIYNPSWAASTNCGPLYDPNDMGEFIGALATRYPQVKYWALYNEVDLITYSAYKHSNGGCFGEPDLDGNGNPDYADYAELMRVAWKAMHDANPNAQLAFGILALDNFASNLSPPDYPGGCCFDYNFLDKLLGYMQQNPLPEGEKYGDVLGFNNYLLYDIYYWERYHPSVGVGAKILAVREIMAKYGFDFPLVITEMSGDKTLPAWSGVPQEVQARQATQMFAESLYYGVQAAMWWTWDDYPDTNCGLPVYCPDFKYGLVTSTFTPKQSYFAVKLLGEQLRGFAPADSKIKPKYANLGFVRGELERRFVFARTSESVILRFQGTELRKTDMWGGIVPVTDGSTQDLDPQPGRIGIEVTQYPLYIQVTQE